MIKEAFKLFIPFPSIGIWLIEKEDKFVILFKIIGKVSPIIEILFPWLVWSFSLEPIKCNEFNFSQFIKILYNIKIFGDEVIIVRDCRLNNKFDIWYLNNEWNLNEFISFIFIVISFKFALSIFKKEGFSIPFILMYEALFSYFFLRESNDLQISFI